MNNIHLFTIFEHDDLVEGNRYNEVEFTAAHHAALENFYKEKNFPYYRLIRRGVRFCEYVGVLQVGKLVIEILPKADRHNDQNAWRERLVSMLQTVGIFNVHAPSSSSLALQSNSILELYISLFVQETEQLLHQRLIKRYRKVEANSTALKGNLLFAQQLQHNLVHQERFYTRHTTYDQAHPLNCVLFQTLALLRRFSLSVSLKSRVDALYFNFPTLSKLQLDETFFQKIIYSSKTKTYQKAIEIARLLLLNYHPDLQKGNNEVLALLFDMNLLWEQFIYKSLKKHLPNLYTVEAQTQKTFWKTNANSVKMKPDIVITNVTTGNCLVLDTKWKNMEIDSVPSPEDLRQLFAYSKFHDNAKTALVYPSTANHYTEGHFWEQVEKTTSCGVLLLGVQHEIEAWQREIVKQVETILNVTVTT
jgi:5-methylcytosine-specific restriction enzyme subunit McrC